MLSWLARHLPGLRRVYVLPQLLDAVLLAYTLARYPAKARAMHALEAEVLSWPGVSAGMHRYGGTEFRRGRREFGHLHGHGLLDIPLTRTVRDQAVAAHIARPHHVFPQSAWVSVDLRAPEDVPMALTLLRRSYEQRFQENQAPESNL